MPGHRTARATLACRAHGVPGGIRTPDQKLRRLLLYPTELPGPSETQPQKPRRARCAPSHRTRPSRAMNLVGVEGFEPPTSTSQMWRATRLRYTPKALRQACSSQHARAAVNRPNVRAARHFVNQPKLFKSSPTPMRIATPTPDSISQAPGDVRHPR